MITTTWKHRSSERRVKRSNRKKKKQKKRAEIDAAKEIGMKWLQRKDCIKCVELQQRVDDLENKLSWQKTEIEAKNESIEQLKQMLKIAENGNLSKSTIRK